MQNVIKDAYISIDLKATANGLQSLRSNLRGSFVQQGVECEDSSPSIHVSIAYMKGDAKVPVIEGVASRIARRTFTVQVEGFEFLQGLATPYDYLVLCLKNEGDLRRACDEARDQLQVRDFSGGFRSHVSLLRFSKGSLKSALTDDFSRELNASSKAAFALGREISLNGDVVRVFNPDHYCCAQFPVVHARRNL